MNQITLEQRQALINAALEVQKRAYAPYSNFFVGAAVLTEQGDFFTGCNIENASFGLTNCAERTAIFSAVAAGQRKIVALAIASEGGYSPCGACRQVLAEFCDDVPILLVDTRSDRDVEGTSLEELLPLRFTRNA